MSEIKQYAKVKSAHGFTSVTPIPSAEELARFYSDVYYQNQASATYQAEYSDEEMAQRRLRANLLIHAVGAAWGEAVGGKRFVEVGCGEGFMLAAAAGAGFDVVGLDFSSYGIDKFHPALTDRVRIGDAFDLLDQFIAADERADVCVLQNVVEHVRDPEGLLERVCAFVGRNGLAVVTVPNDYSRMQERATELGLTDTEYWFVPPQHLHYFNVDSLRAFAGSLSFDVVDTYGDFPIEMFLFHPGSNYVLRREQGKAAHQARLTLDLLLAERGLGPYHRFCQAMSGCGIGRNVTVILRSRR